MTARETYKLARDPDTPSDTLDMLSKNNLMWPDFLVELAGHPNLSIETMQRLSQDENQSVRLAIANNINAPLYLIRDTVEHIAYSSPWPGGRYGGDPENFKSITYSRVKNPNWKVLMEAVKKKGDRYKEDDSHFFKLAIGASKHLDLL